jgi:uncharacterized protein (DUF2164 family)
MDIELPREIEKELITSIRRFFEEKMEEEIGELKARLVLDYCIKEIGPTIYNQAIQDSKRYLSDKLADLDGVCYKPELGYWKKRNR